MIRCMAERLPRTGFSLIELSVVLVISSLMLGFGLQAMQSTGSEDCNTITKQQMVPIQAAIDKYVKAHKSYPRPAGRGFGVTDSQFGRSVGSNSDTKIDSTGGVLYGALPFQTLGLPASYAADCWGDKFSYVVTASLTDSNQASSNQGVIKVLAGPISASVTIMSDAAYAVISHGADGSGAVKKNFVVTSSDSPTAHGWKGTNTAANGSHIDYQNTLVTGIVGTAAFNNGKTAGGAYFDDYIVYARKGQVLVVNAVPILTNGACSATAGTCLAGAVTGDDGITTCGTTRHWSCAGTNGGTTASCTSTNATCPPTTGVCDTSAVLGCTAGTLKTGSDNGITTCGTSRTWVCQGTNGGADSPSCSKANAACVSCTSAACGSTAHGGTCTSYAASTVAYGSTCTVTTSTCNNGSWSTPPAANATCTVASPASCTSTVCGTTLHNGTCTSYAASTVAYGSTCTPTLSTCSNGVWSTPPAANATCTVASPASCAASGACGSTPHGGTCTSYATPAAPSPATCTPITSSCSNGVWSTTPTAYATCSTSNAYCWGWNGDGQLGDGTATQRLTPVAVTGLPAGVSFTQIGSGGTNGNDTFCGIDNNGRAYCWGSNIYGNLGDGTTTNRSTPVAVTGLPAGVSFTQISVGDRTTCGIGSDTKAYCWGDNSRGNLGDGTTTDRRTPVAVTVLPAGVKLTQISAVDYTTCGIGNNGVTYCWGLNSYGQLGNGTADGDNYPPVIHPTPSVVVSSFSQILVGDRTTCGIGSDRKAYCWGYNWSGQLGDGTTTNRSIPVPVTLPAGISSFSQISVGSGTTCGIVNNGVNVNGSCSLVAGNCMAGTVTGDNGLTSCGTTRTWSCAGTGGGTTASCTTINAACSSCSASGACGTTAHGATCTSYAVSSVTSPNTCPAAITSTCNNGSWSVTPAAYGSCTVQVNGSCGATAGACAAGTVTGDNGLTACGTTRSWSCAGTGGGTTASCTSINAACPSKLFCWGYNGSGQLGNGTWTDSSTPVAVTLPAGVNGFTQVAAGYSHSCGIGTNGATYCWGHNWSGELGNGTSSYGGISVPVAVNLPAGVSSFTQLAAGASYSCAIGNNGLAYCWGGNGAGQLGNGTTTQSNTPVAVILPAGVSGFTQVAAGYSHTCGIGTNGVTYCWGGNGAGQLGNGTTTQSNTPVAVILPVGVSNFTQVVANGFHSCGIGNNGKAYCWGRNDSGQLGDGTTTQSSVPVAVSVPVGVSSFTQVAAGYYHTCGIGTNGVTYCWGDSDSSTPLPVTLPAGVSNFTQVVAGAYYSCGIGNNGHAYCWGWNIYGQLGNGTSTDSSVPVAVSMPAGVSNLTQVTAGYWHSCGIVN